MQRPRGHGEHSTPQKGRAQSGCGAQKRGVCGGRWGQTGRDRVCMALSIRSINGVNHLKEDTFKESLESLQEPHEQMSGEGWKPREGIWAGGYMWSLARRHRWAGGTG